MAPRYPRWRFYQRQRYWRKRRKRMGYYETDPTPHDWWVNILLLVFMGWPFWGLLLIVLYDKGCI